MINPTAVLSMQWTFGASCWLCQGSGKVPHWLLYSRRLTPALQWLIVAHTRVHLSVATVALTVLLSLSRLVAALIAAAAPVTTAVVAALMATSPGVTHIILLLHFLSHYPNHGSLWMAFSTVPPKIAFLFSTTGVQALDVVFMLFLQTELGFFCSAVGIRAAGILLLNGGGTWHSASQWQACNLRM